MMQGARATMAGALVMLLGIWIMTNDQTGWSTQDVVFAVLALLGVALLLVGVDIRGKGRAPSDDKKEDKE
jgi:hypothetical membrane protein